ncbi:hypothetical protein [Pseudomonas monteilii]|uniref:hypothetical protein n=1 Tax=Pseudomonas monteilii TaxID=76759 RepID=UPI003D074252
MQPKTEGSEEKGPSDLPFINDPEKPTSPLLNDADATEAAEAEEDIEDDGNPYEPGGAHDGQLPPQPYSKWMGIEESRC